MEMLATTFLRGLDWHLRFRSERKNQIDREMALLKAIRETDIRGDWPGIIGHRVEKSPWFKTRQVECKNNCEAREPSESQDLLDCRDNGRDWHRQDQSGLRSHTRISHRGLIQDRRSRCASKGPRENSNSVLPEMDSMEDVPGLGADRAAEDSESVPSQTIPKAP